MDTDLVVRAQHGDEAAFGRLIEAIEDRFHGLAYAILRDMTIAEDAVQVALLALWRDLPRLRDPIAFEAWSCRVVVRACHAESRRQRRWLPNLTAMTNDDPSADAGLASVVERDELDRAFRRLPFEQRTILVLRHYLDQTIEQVAATLNIPSGTARSRLHRSKEALRAALDAEARGARVLSEPAPPEVAR